MTTASGTASVLADLIDQCYQRGLDAPEAAEFIRSEGWTLIRSDAWTAAHRCTSIGGYIGNQALRCYGMEGHDYDHSY